MNSAGAYAPALTRALAHRRNNERNFNPVVERACGQAAFHRLLPNASNGASGHRIRGVAAGTCAVELVPGVRGRSRRCAAQGNRTAAVSHRAQCVTCQHSRWRGANIVGCLAFEAAALPAVATIALASLVFREAHSAPCAVRSAHPAGPDAFMAMDTSDEIRTPR